MQPIHIAAMFGCSEILKYLGTLPGVNPNAIESTVTVKYNYMYVHMYVCKYVCIAMYIYLMESTCVHTYVCTHIHKFSYIYSYVPSGKSTFTYCLSEWTLILCQSAR